MTHPPCSEHKKTKHALVRAKAELADIVEGAAAGAWDFLLNPTLLTELLTVCGYYVLHANEY